MMSEESVEDASRQALLSKKICELPLRIEGTYLEKAVIQLYKELETADIVFKPKTYLSNGWGCPNEVPIIGAPFYLGDPVLSRLQARMAAGRSGGDLSLMMYLRHEAGHAFNYAYRLFDHPEWQDIFGRFSLPYRDEYKVDPLSQNFVHHLSGFYAQKHPDDDFAETFAVWLTPSSDWQKVYAGTPALSKLRYVEKAVAENGGRSPLVSGGRLDVPFEEMLMTLGEWFKIAA